MKLSKSAIATFAAGALIVGLFGCQKKEGPAEQAGKEIDKGTEKAAQEISKGVDKVGEQIEKAGEKIRDTAKDAKK